MAKGSGVRTRAGGRKPDPNALRRDRADDAEWVLLPQAGRDAPPPDWPLTDQTARESTLWDRLWAMAQAVEWERREQDIEVALYVRQLAEAERPNSPAAMRTLVRQMSDSLGLTTPGMRANRWRIGEPDAPRRAVQTKSRARLKVVAADALEGTGTSG